MVWNVCAKLFQAFRRCYRHRWLRRFDDFDEAKGIHEVKEGFGSTGQNRAFNLRYLSARADASNNKLLVKWLRESSHELEDCEIETLADLLRCAGDGFIVEHLFRSKAEEGYSAVFVMLRPIKPTRGKSPLSTLIRVNPRTRQPEIQIGGFYIPAWLGVMSAFVDQQ